MASLEELKKERLEKLKKIEKKGLNPYPATTKRNMENVSAVSQFEKLVESAKEIILAGRVLALRPQGGIVFVDFNDGTSKFQAVVKKEEVGEDAFSFFSEVVDIGDFVEFEGGLFLTKRNEKTILAKSWTMLSKALLPLPDKWAGLKDEEERLRKRYLDILTSEELKDAFIKRSIFWQAIRDFLLKRNFLEVETPILENTTGGAEAKPFITHHNALDLDVYLRISPELWHKRLMVAGFSRVFEIGRIFRNEGMDAEHLQDYTQMEFYMAYADYRIGMKLVEEMYKEVAEKTFQTLKFKIKNFDIDLGGKWQIYDFRETIKKETGFDIESALLKDVLKKLKELNIEYDKEGINLGRAIDALWKYCRRKIAGPGFLIGVPVYLEPLAKRSEEDKEKVERFQIILAGSEMGKGFSELNDPMDQRGRFMEQAKLREGGDEEAQMNDISFVEALEHGMPPTFGFGLSERLFSFLMNRPGRECQLFPLLKPKNS